MYNQSSTSAAAPCLCLLMTAFHTCTSPIRELKLPPSPTIPSVHCGSMPNACAGTGKSSMSRRAPSRRACRRFLSSPAAAVRPDAAIRFCSSVTPSS
eukprot:m.100423 g.100423  ORF g.100423 m.100423 type:complete len:97 (-) comp15123_c0_seq2:1686-1976(-)